MKKVNKGILRCFSHGGVVVSFTGMNRNDARAIVNLQSEETYRGFSVKFSSKEVLFGLALGKVAKNETKRKI